jgi:hypothetical protein
MLKILEAMQMQCYDAMRDLRVKIGVLHTGLGNMIELEDNESRAGIGFSSGTFNKQGLFKSGGFIHTGLDEEAAAVLEEDTKDSCNFIIPRGVCNNWVSVDIPTVVHKST